MIPQQIHGREVSKRFKSYLERDTANASFFVEAINDEYQSDVQGIAIYKDMECVRITNAGVHDVVHVANANETCFPDGNIQYTYKDRFHAQYENFLESKPENIQGTPLKAVPFLSVAQVKTLNDKKVFSVQQLAGLPAHVLPQFGVYGREWKDKAAKFLETAMSMNEVDKLHARIAELEAAAGAFDPDGDGKPGGSLPASDRKKELRALIKDAGHQITGQPSEETLVKMAEEYGLTA